MFGRSMNKDEFVAQFDSHIVDAKMDSATIFGVFDLDADGVVSQTDLVYVNFFFTWQGQVKYFSNQKSASHRICLLLA